MPDFTRIFAESGLKNTIGDTEYDGGWDDIVGSNPPSFKDFNSIMNEQDSKLADIAQTGVVYWDASIPYQAKALARSTVDDEIYQLLLSGDPTNEPSASPADWSSLAENKTLVHSVDVVTTSSQALTANTPAEITGLSVTLTPQSANSKFLLMANWNGELSSSTNQDSVFGFKRDSSYIGNPAAAGVRPLGRGVLSQGFWDEDTYRTMDSWDGQYLDEPNTTNSITYKVFISTRITQNLYNNRTRDDGDASSSERATSSLIILEIT